jgi:Mitochondrial ATP synthase B chain precursor (ATP-synt_B)
MILKKLIIFVLFVLIVVSKEVLVFNEEILVLFSFVVFSFLFFRYFTSVFSSDLYLRSNKIKEEFCFYEETRKKTIVHVLSYHNKLKMLSDKAKLVLLNTNKNICFVLVCTSLLHAKLLVVEIDDKLKRLISYELTTIALLQKKINSKLFAYLFARYKKKTTFFKKRRSGFFFDSINAFFHFCAYNS